METKRGIQERIRFHFKNLLEGWKAESSQRAFADIAGMSPSFITRYKDGHIGISLETRESFAHTLGTEAEYFLIADERLSLQENKILFKELMKIREGLILYTITNRK